MWISRGGFGEISKSAYFAGPAKTGLETDMPALFLAGVLCLVAALAILAINASPTKPAGLKKRTA